MTSTTGTSLRTYLEWLQKEIATKAYGEVGIHLTITDSQITDVRLESVDHQHFPLKAQDR